MTERERTGRALRELRLNHKASQFTFCSRAAIGSWRQEATNELQEAEVCCNACLISRPVKLLLWLPVVLLRPTVEGKAGVVQRSKRAGHLEHAHRLVLIDMAIRLRNADRSDSRRPLSARASIYSDHVCAGPI